MWIGASNGRLLFKVHTERGNDVSVAATVEVEDGAARGRRRLSVPV